MTNLSDQQINFYNEKGYVAPIDVLSIQEANEIRNEIETIEKMTFRINDFMSGMFRGIGIKLVDFKLEFGRIWNNNNKEVILADEISPDTCRLWDIKSEKKLDKDRFRKDLGNIIQAYQEVARRLGIVPETTNVSEVNFKKPTSINIKKR